MVRSIGPRYEEASLAGSSMYEIGHRLLNVLVGCDHERLSPFLAPGAHIPVDTRRAI